MSKTDDFLSALHGERGELDAWLESRDEKEVRAAILAIVSPQETLRDKFAAMALVAILSEPVIDGSKAAVWHINDGVGTTSSGVSDYYAEGAYKLADAMLKAREAKP